MTVNEDKSGLFQMLPFFIPKGMACESLTQAFLPWHAPSILALSGHAEGKPSERVMVISTEYPIPWIRSAQRISQEEQESLHVHRFRTDHILGTQTVPFVGISKGNDPPDVVVTDESGQIGLECMTFSLAQRRRAQGLFKNVRKSVMANPDSFFALAGHVVHMWFKDGDTILTRPHTQNDARAAENLARALAEYRPDNTELLRPRSELPQQAPELNFETTTNGATFYSVPIAGAAPTSPLFTLAGFELSMSFNSFHSESDEWHALRARIKRKDRPGNDWLLISSGAVDQSGEIHPAEDVLADFLLRSPQPVGPLEHIKRVTVHMWSTGQAVDIWPEYRPLFGPIYLGATPMSQAINPSKNDASGEATEPVRHPT